MTKISVCIPTYVYPNDKEHDFLKKSLTNLSQQTYTNFEVIISDQTPNGNDCVEKCINLFLNKLDIKYIKNEKNPGMSSNTNNCIRHCSGELIKPLFQDDFICHPLALQVLAKHHEKSQKNWYSMKYNHFVYIHESNLFFSERPDPHFNEDIILGVNTLSSPSTIAFTKNDNHYFDEKLCMLMDCDFYHRMYNLYGEPHYIRDSTYVSLGVHRGQTQHNMGDDVLSNEFFHVVKKYNLDKNFLSGKNFPFRKYVDQL